MKISKSLFVVSVILFSYSISIGQDMADRKEKIEAQKITYITDQLQLTPQEAQQFWPLYNEFQVKKEEFKEAKRLNMREYHQQSMNLSDERIEEIVDGYIEIELKLAELQKEYHIKYKSVLPVEKVIKLYQAENQFKQFLLKQIKGQGTRNMQKPKRNF